MRNQNIPHRRVTSRNGQEKGFLESGNILFRVWKTGYTICPFFGHWVCSYDLSSFLYVDFATIKLTDGMSERAGGTEREREKE